MFTPLESHQRKVLEKFSGKTERNIFLTEFKEELKLFKQGYKTIVGLDEAGRGPLAGPVVAAAVCITAEIKNQSRQGGTKIKNTNKKSKIFQNIKDSKKLTPNQREEWYEILTNHSDIKWATGRVSEKVIDRINIKNAAELAMERAIEKLKVKSPKLKVDFLIIDGNNIKNHKLETINYKLMVKADEKVFSCAAASIIAKVTRDKIMVKYAKKYPEYGFERHKGYATEYHRKMLKKYGPCKIHRRSFRPVKFN